MKHVPVVLVGPPLDHHLMPSFAISLLKASLEERGITCKALYTNMLFYETIGFSLVQELSDEIYFDLLLERIFARDAYEDNKEIPPAKYADLEARCHTFLKKVTEEIVRLQPKIVGFSNAFQPVNALVAMAKAVKKQLPNVTCVIGGANCDEEMGEEIAASMGIFDYVFQGEADFAFADFCQNYLEFNLLPKEKSIRCHLVNQLDDVPIPDYSDFFDQCRIPRETVLLPFEGSRGCWWGSKNRCAFCGESKAATGFRFKSAGRMLKELQQLQEKYQDLEWFAAVDSIFPNAYFNDLLPELAARNFPRKVIYSTRTTLTYKQLTRMKEAGITFIFAGIESLSTRLLKLIHKGVNALTSIRLLRDCRELGITVSWNLLVEIPGDRASDYEEQVRLIPLLQHFMPTRLHPIRLQRSSPYFEDPEPYGITGIKPLKAYDHAFPESVNVTRLAYYFTAKYPSESRERPEILVPLKNQLERWQERWKNKDVPKLSLQPLGNDQWIVEDSRDCAKVSTHILEAEDHAILEQCRGGIAPGLIKSGSRLKNLLDLGYLIEADGKLLAVVCKECS